MCKIHADFLKPRTFYPSSLSLCYPIRFIYSLPLPIFDLLCPERMSANLRGGFTHLLLWSNVRAEGELREESSFQRRKLNPERLMFLKATELASSRAGDSRWTWVGSTVPGWLHESARTPVGHMLLELFSLGSPHLDAGVGASEISLVGMRRLKTGHGGIIFLS